MKGNNKGFTLIELLIVIGIIGFLAAAILVAVDPVKRIQDARDSQRWAEVNSYLNGILKNQVDNRAAFDGGDGAGAGNVIISSTDAAPVAQMIIDNNASATAATTLDCTASSGAAADWSTWCPDADTASLGISNTASACMADLNGLVPEYLASLPTDPGTSPAGTTGYYIVRDTAGRITIGSCNGEQAHNISVKR